MLTTLCEIPDDRFDCGVETHSLQCRTYGEARAKADDFKQRFGKIPNVRVGIFDSKINQTVWTHCADDLGNPE